MNLPARALPVAACAVFAALALTSCRDANPPRIHGAQISFVLRDVARIPASSDSAPRARLNSAIPAPDGSHRLFVNDMNGKIHVLEGGKLLDRPFLDMRELRKEAFTSEELFEQGLNTFAFHPDFARAGQPGFGRLYTFSTEKPQSGVPRFRLPGQLAAHHDVIAEWRVDPRDPSRVDAESRRELLRIAHPRHDHVGGQIGFNPASRPSDPDYGKLYVALGDGGNTVPRTGQVDAWRTAQNKAVPFGKILRIDPLGKGAGEYGIPSDNPFVSTSRALGEIWAYGLRNPSRFSWDSAGQGTMLIADIGQTQLEEINIGKPGANYGWSEREGVRLVRHGDETQRVALPIHDLLLGYSYPVVAYGHHLGRAVTGGFVYRGSAVPELTGMYLFGDIASGRVFAFSVEHHLSGSPAALYELKFRADGRDRTFMDIVGASRADLRFGIDDAGEIYLMSKQDGSIRVLAGTTPSDTGIWPVEHPLDPLDGEEATWRHLLDRCRATAYDVLERLKRLARTRSAG